MRKDKYVRFTQEGINFAVGKENKFLINILNKGFNLVLFAKNFSNPVESASLHPINFMTDKEIEKQGKEVIKINTTAKELFDKMKAEGII